MASRPSWDSRQAAEDDLRQFERADGVRIPGLALLGVGRA
jgi:hypothetical protein